MQYSISRALQEYAAQMDSDIQAAVEQVCTPEHITAVVRQTVQQTLDQVIQEEVRNFFLYGAGRHVVKAAVIQKLEANGTYTILDEI